VKSSAASVVLIFGVLVFSTTVAHGDHKPKHGGSMGRGDNDDVIVEFVMNKGTITVYVEDEAGTPLATKGVDATLTLIAPQRAAQDVKLVPAGDGKFTATGLEPVRGDRLRARIVLPTGEALDSISLFTK
jgi:hypothetical protein